jgi:hypothetical protein
MASYKHLRVALEAIDFQSGAFFKELTLVLEPAFSKGTIPNKEEQDSLASHLDKVILRHVGVLSSVRFSHTSTCVLVPDINARNVLINDFGFLATAQDGLKMIRAAADKNMSTGIVDLKKSRISGDFSKYEVLVNIDLDHFGKHKFTAAECAAVLLHEIGHWFTYCEMLDRVTTGNMLLSGLSTVLAGSDVKEREIAIKKAGDAVDMDDAVIQDLQKSTSDKIVVTVFITHISKKAMSSSDHSFYDSNTWEMLSDQFATRHGAGRQLSTALDKLFSTGGIIQRRGNIMYYLGEVLKIIATIVAIIFTGAVLLGGSFLGIVLGVYSSMYCYFVISMDHESDGAPAYDKPKDRFLRVRRQLVEQIKNTKLSKEMITSITGDIKLIDEVISNYNERMGLFEIINNFLFSSSRRRRDSIDFQRNLEKLAMNDLFLSAASLQTS